MDAENQTIKSDNPSSNGKCLFFGTFERALDTKNRITVPSQWLRGRELEFYVMLNPQAQRRFLIVMPKKAFAAIEKEIRASSMPEAKKRIAIRLIYGKSRLVTCDAQGRILLPDDQCSQASLDKETVLIGSKDRFEVWNKKRWESAEADDQAIFVEAANLIGL
ncbi:MAG: division/cell wall cluster transcriptional repressor MraZ [Chthoniobacterales bacterium]